MTNFLSKHPIVSLFVVVATFSTINSARADESLPSQEQGLARALENHPDIVAAKAKVALVEAELYGKRVEVSRQVLSLYGSLKSCDAQIDSAKAALKQAKAELERMKGVPEGAATAAAVHAAEGKLVEAMGRREQAEKELHLLVGEEPQAKEGKSKSPKPESVPAPEPPQGPIVASWRTAAEKTVELSFNDIPLVEVLEYLSDTAGIKFSVQRRALENAGLDPNMPITFSTNKVSLRAALEGFQDSIPELQFVLRDYGILLTTTDYAEEHGYMPVLGFAPEPATTVGAVDPTSNAPGAK